MNVVDPGRRPSAEDAYRTIRDQVLRGERKEGEWLREGDLAESLGVSRTPVREALRRLAAEGLVLHELHRGVQVASWNWHDVEEIFSLRSVLEPLGSALAAGSGLADLEELERLAHAMDAEAGTRRPDPDEMTRINDQFHRRVMEASGNRRLAQIVSAVVEVPLVWRTFSHYSTDALSRSLAHHHELIEALRARDPGWAESVMRSHVRAAHAALRSQRPAG